MTVPSARIGFSRDSEEFRVNTARLAQFARALDDTNEAHLAGRVAPPVFAHIPVMQSMMEVLTAATDAFLLHGEQDFHLHAPIEPGQRLFSQSTLIGLRPTTAGLTLIVRSEVRTAAGELLSTQYATCLATSIKQAEGAGERPPPRPDSDAAGGGEAIAVTHPIAPDQAHRYADAARDYSPYTLDDAAAKAKGLPAAILHGMCTLGIASRAVVDGPCGGDSRRLARLGGRFSHLLFLMPGQAITTRMTVGPALTGTAGVSPAAGVPTGSSAARATGPRSQWAGGRSVVLFETADAQGNVVIKNGFAEVRS